MKRYILPAVVVSVLVACGRSPTPSGKTMCFCGYDLCRESGEYGKLVFETDEINVWENPEPNRGGVHRRASAGEKVTV